MEQEVTSHIKFVATCHDLASKLESLVKTIPPSLLESYKEDVQAMETQFFAKSKGKIRICVTGGIKSGKSSLLSEILKDSNDKVDDLLPAADTRCTARPTVITFGEQLAYQIQGSTVVNPMTSYNDAGFNSAVNLPLEARNNAELVSSVVTLFMNKPFLKLGLEFIDLPGKHENPNIDAVVDKLIPTVDVVVYLFNPAAEFTAQVRYYDKN